MKTDSQDPAQDPRLTAYALGELTDAKEIEAVETLLRGSPELRREVESLRATGELIRLELEQEPVPSLSPHQLANLGKRPRWWKLRRSGRPRKKSWWFPVGLATAAAATVVVSTVILFLQETKEPSLSARLQRPKSTGGEAPPEMGGITKKEHDTVSSGPAATSPPPGRVQTVPVPQKEVLPLLPANQDTSGSSLPVPSDAVDPPPTSPSAPVRSSQEELILESRSEQNPDAPTGTALVTEHAGDSSNSGPSPVSTAGGRVIEPGEIPGSRIIEPRVHPEGSVGRRFFLRERLRMARERLHMAPSVPFSPSVEVRARLDELPAAPAPVPSRSSTEDYRYQEENPFQKVSRAPLSTFGIDVDTASYANVRRFLRQGSLPPRDAVRIEEMVNYFSYAYDAPGGEHPVSALMELAQAPWKEEHLLLRVGVQAREIDPEQRSPSNLVFLLDVSGSMRPANKLPLLKRAMRLLIKNLGEKDRVAFVTYAGESAVVLPSTPCDRKEEIFRALEYIMAGGPTNGEAGIRDAYATAAAHFIPGGTNRVILATDGDFNLGMTDEGSLIRLIRKQSRSGIFLSVLGLGTGNYKDAVLESLANRGNGNFSYLDSLEEARKVLVREMGATLVTVAKDAKIQIEFNPARVDSYRLIGYENRALRDEEFNDDSRDGGEIGAGHQVTVLYEIVPAGTAYPAPGVDPLKYQTPPEPNRAGNANEWLTLKIRYKPPDQAESRLLEFTHTGSAAGFKEALPDFRFASAVAAFGMILRDSPHRGTATLERVLGWALDSTGDDPHGHRGEFVQLVRKAMVLER